MNLECLEEFSQFGSEFLVHAADVEVCVGLEKMLFHCPEQVESPSGQVTFHFHLPSRQGILSK